MIRHTPGPWTWEYNGDSKATVCAPIVGRPRKRFTLAEVEGFTPESTKADARLIAQAPAMLEIIREALVLGWVDTLDARARAILRAVDGE